MEPSGTLQDTDQGFWSDVPEEITARIMSRLPVPAFCTCRAVCKAWNELLRRPAFLDLCDRDEKKDDSPFLFVTVHFVSDWNRKVVHGNYRHMTRFLDLHKGRWFSIGSPRSPSDANVLFLAMNDGLICEFSVIGKECRLVLFDPVSTTTRTLPAVNVPASRIFREDPPAIVTVVHNNNSNFNVFFLSRPEGLHTGFMLYESSTDAWRDLRSPMDELGLAGMLRVRFVESAVYFQGTFYAAFCTFKGVLLGRYNLEENSWKEVFTVESKHPGHPELIVFKNRMFMPIWLDGEAHGSLLHTGIRGGGGKSIFEIREILEDSSSKSVVRIPYLEIQRIFYGEEVEMRLEYDIACAFPINSHSVLLVSRYLGKSVVYDVISGCVAELSAHHLSQTNFELSLCKTFSAKLMNLSVRNILASSSTPVACTREPIKILANPISKILGPDYGSKLVTNRFQQSLQVTSCCTQDQHLEAVDLQAVHEALQMEVKNVDGF